jgi:hypothetical protein
MLFHVSEERGIERFAPRSSAGGMGPVVWAIDKHRLRNYLLPRECPRVTCYAGRDLWPLRDAVVASSLQFSIIRMRNALAKG